MSKDLKKNEPKPEIGKVKACPIMSIGRMAATPCIQGECEFFTELTWGKIKVGRCTFAYLPTLLIELRQSLDKKGANEKSP